MSSSNRVSLALIEETVYGETPSSGSDDFTEVKFTSEDLTGTPLTAESQEIRADRQTSGQVNTGLEMSGGFNFELSADPSIKTFIEQAMMNDIVVASAKVLDITIDVIAGTLATTSDFTAELSDGDIVVLENFVNEENNTVVLINNVTANLCDFVGEGLIDEAAVGGSVMRTEYYDIGVIEKSVSISKEFLDVGAPVKSIAYRGMRVGEMSMNFAFGEIVTGAFALAGNDYELPTNPITDGYVINPAGSDQALDASNGFGWLLVDDTDVDICLESLAFTLNNNLSAVNCIGETAPKNQLPGSANVSFESVMHLGENSWDLFMPAKISQAPISIAFYTRDFNKKGYAIKLNRVQVSFPDPSAAGKDETVTLDASGTASYDALVGNTMRIYIL